VKFHRVHLSNRFKNDAVINCEKSLRTNEALLGELSVFEIGTIQRNGESIEVRPAGNLAENQSWPGRSSITKAGRCFPPATSVRGNGMTTTSPATGLTTRHPLVVSSNPAREQIRSA